VNTVKKVLDILEIFLTTEDELSITELAESSGLPNTTVHRICSILSERGYIYQKNKKGKYSPGTMFLQFQNVNMFAFKIKEMGLPFMKELSKLASESVTLSVWDGSEAVEVLDVVTNRRLQCTGKIGERLPPHCTSVGKILLASKPDKLIREILSMKELTHYTEHTITRIPQIRKELALVRQEGFAFDDEEFEIGLRAISAPVKDVNDDVVAAVGIVGPTVRISRLKMSELSPIVKNCALEISKALKRKVK
jgi:IclR family KDG regulon transcriptional repressor